MKRKSIITSVLVIVLCLGLISGSTFALFTSESKVNIAVTSGKVNIVASLDALKLYSASTDTTSVLTTAEVVDTNVAGVLTGTFAGTYYYHDRTTEGSFLNGGTAAIVTDSTTSTQSLNIQKITPGDKVTLNVKVANNSNVAIQYRVKVNVLSGLKLYEGLVVKTDGVSLQGVQKVGNWTYLDAPTTVGETIATIPVEVYLPLEAGNEYQDLATSMQITVEAVQGNAKTTNEVLAQEVTATANVGTTNTVLSDNYGLVEATVPTAALADTSISSLTLKVKPQDTVSNITITSLQETLSYDVKVLETTTTNNTSAIKENNTAAITVRMFVGTGLTGVKLYHNTDEITNFTYDSTTGYIQFTTNSFSEYTVVYNKDIAVETVNEQTQKSTITVYTPTEDENVYVDSEGKVVKIDVNEETKDITINSNYIAYRTTSTGTVFYSELAKAFVDLSDGETLHLMKDVESGHCFLYANAGNAKFDLEGFTLKVTGCPDSDDPTLGFAAGGRAIKIKNGTLTIENGTIDGRNYANGVPTANPSTGGPWGATRLGGAVRISGGNAVLNNLVMYNNDGWGNAVKLESDNTLTMTNCKIVSVYGACIEIGTGTANIESCDFVEYEIPAPAYHATCVAVCDGGTVNIDKDVTGKKTTAEGGYALFVYNTGGTINVYDGTYTGTESVMYSDAGDNEADSVINVYGGTFSGTYVVSGIISNGYSASINICGGTFDHDPTSYVAPGYSVQTVDNKYVVEAFDGGSGTENDPFIISSNKFWKNFVALTKDDSDFSETAGKYFKVTTDLDVSDYGTERANIHYFAGTIDFTGHTFTGLTADNSPASDVGDDGITAIFSRINGNVKVSNLDFYTTTVTNGGHTVAAQVTGRNTGDVDVEFENINTYGSVTGSNINNNGLFISYVYNGDANITLKNCNNYANIIGPGYKSAFLGNMGYGNVKTITATNCHNYGTIISTNKEASMFISNAGYFNHNIIVTIDDCSNEGNIGQNTTVARYNLVTTRVDSQYKYVVNGNDMSSMTDTAFNTAVADELSGSLVYTISATSLATSEGKFVLNSTEGATKYVLSFSFFAGGHAAGGGAGYVLTLTPTELTNANIMVYDWINKSAATGEIVAHTEYGTTYYTCGEHYVFNSDNSNIRDNVFVSLTAYDANDVLLSIATFTYPN